MLITRVELENIKNYEEGDYEFGPGVTAISGPNGAGKTTILEAIAWALFDYLPYKKEDFLRRGARKGSVRVTFESALDQRQYTVYRDTGTGYYVYDPITKLKLVEQKSQVGSWIRQHLGVEPGTDLKSLFTSTIGVPQGTFTVDFADQPARRKISFDRVLRVDEYQKSSEELRAIIRLVEERDVVLREEIARLEVEVFSLDPLLEERARYEASAQRLNLDLVETDLRKEQTRSELEQLDNLQSIIGRLDRDLIAARIRLAELEQRRATLSEEVSRSRRASELVAASQAGHSAYNEAAAILEELEQQGVERDSLRQEAARSERELIKAETTLQSRRDRLAQLESDRNEVERLAPLVEEQKALEARCGELQMLIGEMGGLKQRIPRAEGELVDFRKEYAQLIRQVEDAEGLKDLAERAPLLDEERRRVEADLREIRVSLERLNEQKKELGRAREKIRKLEAEIKTVEKDLYAAAAAEELSAALPQIEAEAQAATEEAATLRERIKRETEIIAGIKDGLCPLLAQRCLNMREGEGLDQYFKTQIGGERGRLTAVEENRKKLQSRLVEARSALKSASALAALKVQHFRYKQDLDIERESARKLQSDIEGNAVSEGKARETSSRLDHLDRELKSAQEARVRYEGLPLLKDRQDRLKREGTRKKSDLEAMKTRLAELEGYPSELQAIEKKLALLDDPRGRSRSLVAGLEKEKEVRESVISLEENVRLVSSKLTDLSTRLAAFAELDGRMATERARRASCEADYRAYIENLPLAAMLEGRESDLRGVEFAMASDRQALEAIEDELNRCHKQYDVERHVSAKRLLEELIDKAAAITSELGHASARLAELGLAIEALQEAKERLEVLRLDRERCGHLHSLSDFIRDVLKRAAPFITEALLQSISMEANQLYRDITGNPMVSLRWDSGYEIVLEEEGHERAFLSLSGGEQMAAALSVRLALLKELSEMRVAFFDEPTTNMDEDRRRNLAQQIGRIKDFDQLFVISHDDAFEGFTDQVVSVKGSTGGA
jgi:exonuclease SbcC